MCVVHTQIRFEAAALVQQLGTQVLAAAASYREVHATCVKTERAGRYTRATGT